MKEDKNNHHPIDLLSVLILYLNGKICPELLWKIIPTYHLLLRINNLEDLLEQKAALYSPQKEDLTMLFYNPISLPDKDIKQIKKLIKKNKIK